MVAPRRGVEHADTEDQRRRNMIRMLARALTPHVVPLPVLPVDDELPEAQESAGCGWFDSSLDLKQGLEVRELSWDMTLAAFRAA
jgi:hypothetical protein